MMFQFEFRNDSIKFYAHLMGFNIKHKNVFELKQSDPKQLFWLVYGII